MPQPHVEAGPVPCRTGCRQVGAKMMKSRRTADRPDDSRVCETIEFAGYLIGIVLTRGVFISPGRLAMCRVCVVYLTSFDLSVRL